MEKKEKPKTASKKQVFPIVIISVLIVMALIFSVIFALININNDKILGNISIMGIDVGKMTREEAEEAIYEVINVRLSEELEVKKDDYETSINANQINAKFDVENAVNEAYNIGRAGNIVVNNYAILGTMLFGNEIECNLNYSQEALDKKIEDISSKLPGAVVQSSYYIEGEELIIVKGKEGLRIKKDELKNAILEEIKDINHPYELITIPTETVQPDAINLEEIRKEIYKEPQDASVTQNEETNKTEVKTEVNGIDFAISIEEAEKILAEEKEEYVIPLKITVPEKTCFKVHVAVVNVKYGIPRESIFFFTFFIHVLISFTLLYF